MDLIDITLQGQNILLWLAEAEIGVAEPFPAAGTDLTPEEVQITIDHLIRMGLLCHDMTSAGRSTSQPVSLTGQGARVVVELWHRRARELPGAQKTA